MWYWNRLTKKPKVFWGGCAVSGAQFVSREVKHVISLWRLWKVMLLQASKYALNFTIMGLNNKKESLMFRKRKLQLEKFVF